MKVGDKQLRLVEHVSEDWQLLGFALEFNYAHLKVIERETSDPYDSCHQLLHIWLSGETGQPITWSRLIEALQDIGYSTFARELETILTRFE